jgi:hypothetical protein
VVLEGYAEGCDELRAGKDIRWMGSTSGRDEKVNIGTGCDCSTYQQEPDERNVVPNQSASLRDRAKTSLFSALLPSMTDSNPNPAEK